MADSSASATATSAEQASAILQVNHELGQMSSITQSTQSAAELSATAVEVLSGQVKTLRQRIADLNRDFRNGQDRDEGDRAPEGRRLPTVIDLTSEPPSYAAAPHFSGFTAQKLGSQQADGEMEEFEAPFKRMAARAWEAQQSEGAVPEIRTGEGDRIVRSGQNIKLDDAEFGRY
jgi:hypothetical protein